MRGKPILTVFCGLGLAVSLVALFPHKGHSQLHAFPGAPQAPLFFGMQAPNSNQMLQIGGFGGMGGMGGMMGSMMGGGGMAWAV